MSQLKIKNNILSISLNSNDESTGSSDCDDLKCLSKVRKLEDKSEERDSCPTPALGLSPREHSNKLTTVSEDVHQNKVQNEITKNVSVVSLSTSCSSSVSLSSLATDSSFENNLSITDLLKVRKRKRNKT